jgi:hypothetical protein
MLAKVVDGGIDPGRIDQAERAVTEELIPLFDAHAGAGPGFWLVEPQNGHVLAITLWSGAEALAEAAAADGAERAAVAERIGLRVRAVTALTVLGSHVGDPDGDPSTTPWARVTWVEGIRVERRADLPALHDGIVADQGRSEGFRSSFWIGDTDRGEGFALSLWAAPADLHSGAIASRRRRRQVTRTLGCRIGAVHQYRALGITSGSSRQQRCRPVDAVPGGESRQRPLRG